MTKVFRSSLLTLIAVFSFSFLVSAQSSTGTEFPGVKIGNFGQMDDNFYRGAQPLQDDYKALADLGIKTIIDLRNDPTDYEKSSAEAVGIKYINIPMSGWKSPKDKDLQEFMRIANDPETGKFFVHCKAGIHRTGVAGAVYRMNKYGWDYDRSYAEMKKYNFSSGLVHGSLKSYVRSYAQKVVETKKLEAKSAATLRAAGAAESH